MSGSISNNSINQSSNSTHLNQSKTVNPELAQQFSGMLKQKESYTDSEYKDALEEAEKNTESLDNTNLKKVRPAKYKTALDEEPSLPQTINHIQKRLIRLSKSDVAKERIKELKDHAQKTIDTLKEQGYKLDNLELPEDAS